MKKQIKQMAVLTLSFLCTGSPVFGQWQKYVVDDHSITTVSVDIGDVDGDNRPDILAAANDNAKFLWYQNNYPNWIPHTIDSTGIYYRFF